MPLDTTIGQDSPRIAPADAMVIDISVKNRVVALWKCCSKTSIQKAQHGPSTQLIEAASCVERSSATIKAEEHSLLSCYQTLTTDKNCYSYQSPKRLIKKWTDMTVHSCEAVKHIFKINYLARFYLITTITVLSGELGYDWTAFLDVRKQYVDVIEIR